MNPESEFEEFSEVLRSSARRPSCNYNANVVGTKHMISLFVGKHKIYVAYGKDEEESYFDLTYISGLRHGSFRVKNDHAYPIIQNLKETGIKLSETNDDCAYGSLKLAIFESLSLLPATPPLPVMTYGAQKTVINVKSQKTPLTFWLSLIVAFFCMVWISMILYKNFKPIDFGYPETQTQ